MVFMRILKQKSSTVEYTPADLSHWNGNTPTTVQEALDLIAAHVSWGPF